MKPAYGHVITCFRKLSQAV